MWHRFLSVQFSRSVVSDSLRPHESQHARPPCPSPTPGVHPDSRPSSQWCHPAISSSVVPFSSCPQSLPASESFPMSQRFSWGGQSIGVSALASVLPKNTQDWSPLGLTGWISLQSKDGLDKGQKWYGPNRSGNPLQYSCLENPMDGGAWYAAIHGVVKSRTRLSDFTFTFHFHALEKEMATHSSVLAWRIPGTGEPDGLPSMGSHRVGHD